MMLSFSPADWEEGYSSGNWEASLDIAQSMLQEDSSSSGSWAMLSLSSSSLGEDSVTAMYALKALNMDSSSALAWTALGRSKLLDGSGGEEEFLHALQLDPSLLLARIGLASCHTAAGDYSKALSELDIVMSSDSAWMSAWLQMSDIYRYQNMYGRAVKTIEKAMDIWPENVQLQFEKAWLLELSGDADGAEAIYRRLALEDPQDTESLIDLGLLLEDQDRFGEAVKVYREMSIRDPEDYWCLGEMGICYEFIGDIEAARRSYIQGLEVEPDYSFASYRLGLIAENEGNVEEAIEWYARCTESDPDFVEAWVAQGLLMEDYGDYASAEEVYRLVLEADPEYSWAWGELGIVLEQQGKPEEAAEAYENGIAVNSQYNWAWEQRGLLYEDEGDLDAAIEWYLLAIDQLEQPGVWLLGELGFVYEQAGDASGAIEYYSQAIDQDSSYTFGMQRLAPLLAMEGEYPAALELWDSYIAMGGYESTALCEKIRILERSGRYDEADSVSMIVAESYPFGWIDLAWSYVVTSPDTAMSLARRAESEAISRDAEFWTLTADLFAELEEEDDALRAYGMASESTPDSIDVWLNWGYYLFDLDKMEEAAEKYGRAVEIDSLSFAAWSSLGEALLFADQYEPAREALEKALELQPQSPWVYAYMGLAYEQQGNSEKAMDYYFEALALSPGYEYAENRIRIITDTGFDPDWNRRMSQEFALELYIDTRVDNGNVRERKYSGGLDITYQYDDAGSEISLEMDHSFIETSKDYQNDYTWTMIKTTVERELSGNFTVSASSSWDRQPGTVRPWQLSSYLSFGYKKWVLDWFWFSPSFGIGQVNTHWDSGLDNERTDRTTFYGSMSLWFSSDDSILPSLWLWGNFYIPPDDSRHTLMNGLAELTFEMWSPLSLTLGYSVGYTRTPAYDYWEKYDTEFYSRLNVRLF